MKYELRAVNNGWIVYVEPVGPAVDSGMPFGEFVFQSFRDMVNWLADRHDEMMPQAY